MNFRVIEAICFTSDRIVVNGRKDGNAFCFQPFGHGAGAAINVNGNELSHENLHATLIITLIYI